MKILQGSLVQSRIIKFLISLLLMTLNIYLVTAALDFANTNPFSRIIINNRLDHSLTIFNEDNLYHGEILSINGIELHTPVLEFLSQCSEPIKQVLVKKDSVIHTLYFTANQINTDLFVFLFFLLIIGNLHLIWGLILYFAKMLYSSSRYYAAFSGTFGMLYLATVFYFTKGATLPIIFTSFLFLFIVVKLLIRLWHLKHSRVIGYICAALLSLIALYVSRPLGNDQFLQSYSMFIKVLLLTGTVLLIVAFIRNLGNRYRNKVVVLISAAVLLSIIAPLYFLLLMIHYDFPIPLSFTSILTVIAPIVIGKSLIENSQISESLTRKLHTFRFAIDIISALLIALFLSGVLLLNTFSAYLYIPSLFASLNIILAVRKFLHTRCKGSESGGRDRQTASLQKIVETSIRPINLDERIENIYREIRLYLTIRSVELVLFEGSELAGSEGTTDQFRILSENNPIVNHFRSDRDIIKRDLRFSSEIDDFLKDHQEMNKYYLIIPVTFKKVVSAVIMTTEKYRRNPFVSSDYTYLATAGTILYQSFENEFLLHHSLIKNKYEQDLDNASYVQMRLFPVYLPIETGLELSLYTRPYNKVTGDYLDFIEIDENHTAIFIGDITGHGLPAAMLHSTTSALITALIKQNKSLSEIFYSLNDFLINKYRGYELMTLFGAIFDKSTTSLEYINAGHPAPYLMHPEKETFITIKTKGHILGVTEEAEYTSKQLSMLKKSQLFLYTDGLTEIQKGKLDSNIGEEFLEKKLQQRLKVSIEEKVEEFTSFISKVNKQYISDDITIAAIEVD